MASFTHSVCLHGYENLLPLWPVLHIRSVFLDIETATIMASFTHLVCLPGHEKLLQLWPIFTHSVCLPGHEKHLQLWPFCTVGLFAWTRETATIMAMFTHSVCLPGHEELLPLWPVLHIRSVCLDTRNCYSYGHVYTFGLCDWTRETAPSMDSFTHSVIQIQTKVEWWGWLWPSLLRPLLVPFFSLSACFLLHDSSSKSTLPSLPASLLADKTIHSVRSNTYLSLTSQCEYKQ